MRPNGTVAEVRHRLAAPTRLEFSWNIEPPDEHAGVRSEVIVTLSPSGTGTDLVIRHEKLARPGAAARHAGGWPGAVDQLSALLDATADVPQSKETPQ